MLTGPSTSEPAARRRPPPRSSDVQEVADLRAVGRLGRLAAHQRRRTPTTEPARVLVRAEDEEDPPPGQADAPPGRIRARPRRAARAWPPRRASRARSGVAPSTQCVSVAPSRTRRTSRRAPRALRRLRRTRAAAAAPPRPSAGSRASVQNWPGSAYQARCSRCVGRDLGDRALGALGREQVRRVPGDARRGIGLGPELRAWTSTPSPASGASVWRPMNPLAPVTRTRRFTWREVGVAGVALGDRPPARRAARATRSRRPGRPSARRAPPRARTGGPSW